MFGIDIAVWGLIASVISAAYSGYQQHEAADASADQAEANAEHDALVMRRAAEQERQDNAADSEAEAKARTRKRHLIEASYAQSGLEMSGTPIDYLTQQAQIDSHAQAQISSGTVKRTFGLEARAANTLIAGRSNAAASRYAGRGSLIGGGLSAFSTGANGYSGYKTRQARLNYLKGA